MSHATGLDSRCGASVSLRCSATIHDHILDGRPRADCAARI